MPSAKRALGGDPINHSETDDEGTPTKIAKNESMSLTDIRKLGSISEWVTFRVEVIYPVRNFTNKRASSPGKTQRLYKFLFSDGDSCTLEGTAYDDNGESIMKQFKEDKVYSVKGQIEVKERTSEFMSESNSEFFLQFNKKLTICPEKDHEGTWKPYGVRIQEVYDRIRRDEIFITRLNGLTLVEGKLHRYWGCGLCKTSIRHPNLDDGKFYCPSSLEPCKNDKTERERKLYMIIKNCVLKESSNADEALHDVIFYDSECKDLLEKEADELGDDDIAAQEYVNKVLVDSKLDIKIQVKKDAEKNYSVSVDKILFKKLATSEATSINENDQDDAEPFEDGVINTNAADESVEEEDVVPNLVDLKVTDTQTETYRDKNYVYDLTSRPQALVLLINNHNFENKYGQPEPPRKGSETDVTNVKDTFTKLGCEIFDGGFHDVKQQDLMTILVRFKSEVIKRKISSIFVVVMSHGNSQEVQMVDGNMVNMWTDIVYPFNDENFPEYRGYPKIFVFQTCQTFPLTTHSSLKRPQNGTSSDILVALPNIPGYTSKRNKRGLGSWYIYYLTRVLRELASSTELVDMLGEVQRRLKAKTEEVLAKKPTSGNVLNSQISTWKPILFNKFYFNVPPQAEQPNAPSINISTDSAMI